MRRWRDCRLGSTGCTRRSGRPSIPPEQLLRALLLQMLYSIRSERLLMEELDYNILYRWFVGSEPRRSDLGRDDVHEESRPAARRRHRRRVLRGSARGDQGRRPAVRRALHRRRHAARGVGESQEFQTEGRRAAAARRSEESDGRISTGRRGATTPISRRPIPTRGCTRKAVGREAKLAYLGPSAHRESPRLHHRHGGHRGERHRRTRRRDRDARRVAADDAAHHGRRRQSVRHPRAGSPPFDACASRRTWPRTNSECGGSAIDARTTRHVGLSRSVIESAS